MRKKSCRIEKGQRQRELDRETGTVFGEWAKTNQFKKKNGTVRSAIRSKRVDSSLRRGEEYCSFCVKNLEVEEHFFLAPPPSRSPPPARPFGGADLRAYRRESRAKERPRGSRKGFFSRLPFSERSISVASTFAPARSTSVLRAPPTTPRLSSLLKLSPPHTP